MNKGIYFNSWLNYFFLLFIVSLYLFFAPVPIEENSNSIPHLDKLAHFIIFFSLLFLLLKADLANSSAASICLIYAILSETIQYFLIYRESSLGDLFFDILGIIFALLLFYYLKNDTLNINK